MLSYAKSATARPGDSLNGFENGKTQLFNSRGDGKWAYFQKKWSVPLKAWLGQHLASIQNRIYMYIYVCVCVCVCVYIYIYIYIYIYSIHRQMSVDTPSNLIKCTRIIFLFYHDNFLVMFKGLVYPKMKYFSSFTHPHVVPSFEYIYNYLYIKYKYN